MVNVSPRVLLMATFQSSTSPARTNRKRYAHLKPTTDLSGHSPGPILDMETFSHRVASIGRSSSGRRSTPMTGRLPIRSSTRDLWIVLPGLPGSADWFWHLGVLIRVWLCWRGRRMISGPSKRFYQHMNKELTVFAGPHYEVLRTTANKTSLQGYKLHNF